MAITSSQPISYVENKSAFRNAWRESQWGSPGSHVYAVPSNNTNSNIYAGPGYVYGYTYEDNATSAGGNCTWWCWGRYKEFHGISLPQWGNGGDWAVNKSIRNVSVGDVLVWAGRTYGHVQFVEAVNGDTITVSESYEGIGRDTACVIQYISKSNPQYGSIPYDFKGVYSGGGGGGDDPDDPPPPQPGGHWEWVEETVTTITSYSYTYSDIYECGGTDIFGSQSGTQDDPQAPTSISTSTSRLNQRWEPFNMYTDERTLTYTADGQPVWSAWETKYIGSDNFPLGQQPTYGNGWKMEWGDDG